MPNLTRRQFIKATSLAALSMAIPAEIFAAGNAVSDIVVHGKIFSSKNNRIAEAFSVKDGKFIYVGDKKDVESYIRKKERLKSLNTPIKVL